jgi:hypothetical protein
VQFRRAKRVHLHAVRQPVGGLQFRRLTLLLPLLPLFGDAMMRTVSLSRRRVLGLSVVLIGALALTSLAAKGGGAKVMPIQSKSHGLSYADWSVRWWQWCFSLPVDRHPLFDTADSSEGQTGNVWFLGGTFTVIGDESGEIVTGVATRDCTIPPGTSLFFPILNIEASTLEGNGETEAALREVAVTGADHIVPGSLVCTIDGVPVHDLDDYRVESPLFVYGPLPDNNIAQSFGIDAPEGTTSLAVGDGIYVMVPPLSAGKHKIHFEGVAMYTEAEDGFNFIFSLDITYNITVKRK